MADLLYSEKDWAKCGPAFDSVVAEEPTGPEAAKSAYAAGLCYQNAYEAAHKGDAGRKSAGNLPSLREYHRRRAAGDELEPLPYLLVIVDEFGELLASRPEFIDLFVAVGRLGRSLGMHLLLSSQQLEEGRLRGLEGHLSYRIALRTFSAQESRAVLGVPDAAETHAPPPADEVAIELSTPFSVVGLTVA